jgi:hypothetical protein
VAEHQDEDTGVGDIDELRTKLAARAAACFDRIEDAVSELVALHSVHRDQILARVEAAIATAQETGN